MSSLGERKRYLTPNPNSYNFATLTIVKRQLCPSFDIRNCKQLTRPKSLSKLNSKLLPVHLLLSKNRHLPAAEQKSVHEQNRHLPAAEQNQCMNKTDAAAGKNEMPTPEK